MQKYILLFLTTLLLAHFAEAQVITGEVKDSNGPLIGATVFIEGTSVGTISDVNGNFSLPLTDASLQDSSLVVTMIGYQRAEVPIGSRTQFSVVLVEDKLLLDEVVVVGYSTQERQKITGAISTIKPAELVKIPSPTVDQLLQGRAPGVVVAQNTGAPGEGVSVRVRGIGSINSSNSPLYIVDGVPTYDAMNSLSPQDIENISILKDASASAIYGARATNGVVIITTKSGKADKMSVMISSQLGVQSPSRMIEMANTEEYVSIYNEAATADNATKNNPLFYRPLITDEIRSGLGDVSYIDEIMRDAVLQSHSISLSGGDEKTKYYISGSFFDQEGIIKSSDYNRVTGRVNLSSQIKKWLKAGTNINIAKSTTNLIPSSGDGAGGNGGSVIRYALFRTPAIPVRDASGVFTDRPERSDLFGDGYNPVGMLTYNNNRLVSNRFFGRFFVDIELFKGLTFTSNAGIDFSSQSQRRFDRNWGTDNRINNPNRLQVTTGRNQALTLSNFLTYDRNFGLHNLTVLLGTEAIKNEFYTLFQTDTNFPDQEENLIYLGNGQGQRTSTENLSGNSLLSFYGKINYDYDSKYLASVTLRRDGSSRFGENNRWGNFYAGSLGWRLDRENFLVDNSLISKLLIRGSYGVIGNQEIGNYAFSDAFGSNFDYPFGNIRGNGYAIVRLGNNNIKWESSSQLNVGLDLGLWRNKLLIYLDYFNKTTYDMLVQRPIATSAGSAESPYINDGKILNRGVELGLEYLNKIGGLEYSVAGNVATLQNKVLELNAPIAGGAYGSQYITRTEEGQPVSSFYMYEMEGIFQDEGEIFTSAHLEGTKPGDVKYKDQNQDGVIDGNDRKHLGSSIPKVTAGLNISLNFKNIDLSVFFQGAYGQKIFSVLNRDVEGFYRSFNVTKRYYDNHWTGPGSTNEYPRASWDASANNTILSGRFLEDGSYTRLKNIQLGYNLPIAFLERYGLQAARVFFSGANLLTWSKYSGMDPEMTVSDNARGEGDRSAGIDWGTYPSARSYNIGVNITF